MSETLQIYQWLYISTVTPNQSVALDDILRISRRNNSAVQVTGLLMFNGKRFLQVLEGPSAAVAATYARISIDPRHRAPVILSRKTVAVREFGEWSMGFKDGKGCNGSVLFDKICAKVKSVSPGLQAELIGFARQIST